MMEATEAAWDKFYARHNKTSVKYDEDITKRKAEIMNSPQSKLIKAKEGYGGADADSYVWVFLKAIEAASKNIKAASTGTVDNLVKVAAHEKLFLQVIISEHDSVDEAVWSKALTQARTKGCFLFFGDKEFAKIYSKNHHPVFEIADVNPGKVFKQTDCSKFNLSFLEDILDEKREEMVFPQLEKMHPKVQHIFSEIFGKKFTMAPVKSAERVGRKLDIDKKKKVDLLDYIRGSIVVDTPEELADVVAKIKDLSNHHPIKLLRLKNGFRGFAQGHPEAGEYPRMLFNLMVSDTLIIELQATLKAIKTIQKVDHVFYELGRARHSNDFVNVVDVQY